MAEDKQANVLNIFGRFTMLNIDEELKDAQKNVEDWCKGNKKINQKCTEDVEDQSKSRVDSILDVIKGTTPKLLAAFAPEVMIFAFHNWKETVDSMIHENVRFVDSYAEVFEFMAKQGVPFGFKESAEALGFMAQKGIESKDVMKDMAAQSLRLGKSLGMSATEAGDFVFRLREIERFDATQVDDMASAILNIAGSSRLSVKELTELSKQTVDVTAKFRSLSMASDTMWKKGLEDQQKATKQFLALSGAMSNMNLESAKIPDLIGKVGEGTVEAMQAETALAHLTNRSVQEIRTMALSQGDFGKIGIEAVQGIQKEIKSMTADTTAQLQDVQNQMAGLSENDPLLAQLRTQEGEIKSRQGVIIANYQATFKAITGTQLSSAQLIRLAAMDSETAANEMKRLNEQMQKTQMQAKVRERVMKDVRQLMVQLGRIGELFLVVIGSRLVRWLLPAVKLIADGLEKMATFMGTFADMTTEAGEGTSRVMNFVGVIVNSLVDMAAFGAVFFSIKAVLPKILSLFGGFARMLGFSTAQAGLLSSTMGGLVGKVGMLAGRFFIISFAISAIKDLLKKTGMISDDPNSFFREENWNKLLNLMWLALLPLSAWKLAWKGLSGLVTGRYGFFTLVEKGLTKLGLQGTAVADMLKGGWQKATGFMRQRLINFAGFMNKWLPKLFSKGGTLLSIFKEAFKLGGKNIARFIGGALKFIFTKIPGVGAIIGILFDYRKIIDAFKEGGIIEGLKQLTWSAINGLLLGLPDLFLWLTDKVFGEGTGEKIKNWLWDNTIGWLMDFGYKIGDTLGGIIEWVKTNAGNLGELIIEGLKSSAIGIKDAVLAPFKESWAWLKGKFTGESPSELSIKFMEGFKAIGPELLGQLLSPFTATFDAIMNAFPNVLDVVRKVIESAFGGTAGKLFTKALSFLGIDVDRPAEAAPTAPAGVPAVVPQTIPTETGAQQPAGDTIVNMNQTTVEQLLMAMLKELASMRMQLAQQAGGNNPVTSLAL